MSDAQTRVEGVPQLMEAIGKLQYGEADKAIKLAMTDAAKVAVKGLKAAMPHKMFRNLAKYKFKQGGTLKFINIGLFDRHKTLPQVGYANTPGNNKPVWMVAYWLNYGTLNRRDRTHTFVKGIKNKSVNSKRGVRPQRFYQAHEQQMSGAYHGAFQEALVNRTKNFYGKQDS